MDDDIRRTTYAGLLVDIGEFYHGRWIPVDRLLRGWLVALVVGMMLVVLGGDSQAVLALGVALGATATAGAAITAVIHTRRTRLMLAMHQRALRLLRDEEGWTDDD